MRYYAIVDTNVIVSAALPSRSDSPPKRIIGAIVKGTIVPIHSEYLLNEYRGVLQRDRFRFDRNDVDILVGFLESTGISVEPLKTMASRSFLISITPSMELLNNQ